MIESQTVVCPECGSEKVHHSGKRLLNNQEKKLFKLCAKHLLEAKSNSKNWRLL